MTIALNALYVGNGVAGGRVYRDGLLHGFTALEALPDRFVVFTRDSPRLPEGLATSIQGIAAPVPGASTLRRTLWEYGVLPPLVRSRGYRLYHALGSLTPRIRGLPVVLTIHDLIYQHFPESVPRGYRLFMQAVQPRAARMATRVIVDSQHVAAEVIERLGVRPERVRVVPLGPGQDFHRVTDAEVISGVLDRFGITSPYCVAVGRGYPHKNIAGLLKALVLVLRQRKDVRLVLIGERYRAGPALEKLIAESKLETAVVWTGFVGRAELNALYSGASAFVFPSLAEGFGLPVLEAMQCGAPVVASSLTAIPEVVGNAGLLVDPRDPEALADALLEVLEDQSLRQELREKGLRRVAAFTWKQCAEETLDVYRELL